MNRQDINCFIYEKVEKKKGWYLFDPEYNINYFSDEEYLPFLRRCQKEEWWSTFLLVCLPLPSVWKKETVENYEKTIIRFILDPDQMLPAIAKWHEMKEQP